MWNMEGEYKATPLWHTATALCFAGPAIQIAELAYFLACTFGVPVPVRNIVYHTLNSAICNAFSTTCSHCATNVPLHRHLNIVMHAQVGVQRGRFENLRVTARATPAAHQNGLLGLHE
jgi:hypothetical protein